MGEESRCRRSFTLGRLQGWRRQHRNGGRRAAADASWRKLKLNARALVEIAGAKNRRQDQVGRVRLPLRRDVGSSAGVLPTPSGTWWGQVPLPAVNLEEKRLPPDCEMQVPRRRVTSDGA